MLRGESLPGAGRSGALICGVVFMSTFEGADSLRLSHSLIDTS
jgi:hypothetical protein